MDYTELSARIIEKYRKEFKNFGTSNTNVEANIFEILQIENKEVLFCRFLGYILDPESKFNNGNDLPVKSFIKEVLKYKETIDDYKFKVILEEQIEGDRRVDIVIHENNDEIVFPIEVKINAGDQPSQLYDYYHHYFGTHRKDPNCIFYLTLTSKKPSDKSITKTDKSGERHSIDSNNYKTISYGEDGFTQWLDSINKKYYGESKVAFYLVEQFIKEINNMAKKGKTLNALYNVFGLNEKWDNNNEEKEFLVNLIECSDSIKMKLMQDYLLNRIRLPKNEGFILSLELEPIDREKDSHCILKIVKDERTVAWIAVATNLYIITEHLKSNVDAKKSSGGLKCWEIARENDYIWRYIGPNISKKFNLGSRLSLCLESNNNIDLTNVLGDIDTDYRNR